MKIYRSVSAGKKILDTYDRLLAEWGVPTVPQDVPTRYGSTHVHVFGQPEGRPLVLFHGVGDDSALMWLYNAAALAPHFRLYAVDTLGGPGRSAPGPAYNKSFDDALWIDDLLDGLGLGQVFAAGVSHGGYLVQYYALTRPERVIRAAALASSVPAGPAANPMGAMLRIFLPEALIPTARNVKRLLEKLSGRNSAAFTGNPLLVEHYTCLLRGFNTMAMRNHKVRGFTDEEIAGIRDKVLYLIGGADPFARSGGIALLQQYRMNMRCFAEAGHGINHELPVEIHAALVEYFCEQPFTDIAGL